ncbi:M23 family metallopeptidase [Falsiroseomonas sp.]|uniref:M23 family metallopeptidase n=1 Tax=Falsiroseomonas sp. TaxID=2870721 RepID=UPI003F730523
MRLALSLLLLAPALARAEEPRLALPLTPACISSPFGPRSLDNPRASGDHKGIDIPAPAGAWVRAAAAGTVTTIRRTRAGTGLEVELRHADGLVTRYAHLGAVAPTLANGRRRVAEGEAIGRIGRTGITTGTHLHLEVLREGRHLDPAPFLAISPCA